MVHKLPAVKSASLNGNDPASQTLITPEGYRPAASFASRRVVEAVVSRNSKKAPSIVNVSEAVNGFEMDLTKPVRTLVSRGMPL